MSGHLRPIKLDSYKPLRELVCENIRQAIIDVDVYKRQGKQCAVIAAAVVFYFCS